MRTSLTLMHNFMICLSLLVGLGLSGCATEDIAPVVDPCDTNAVVRFCSGNTTVCPTEHTTLQLEDGTLLRPIGPAWESYLPRQADGQRVRMGYTLGDPVNGNGPGERYATLTCFQILNAAGDPE